MIPDGDSSLAQQIPCSDLDMRHLSFDCASGLGNISVGVTLLWSNIIVIVARNLDMKVDVRQLRERGNAGTAFWNGERLLVQSGSFYIQCALKIELGNYVSPRCWYS